MPRSESRCVRSQRTNAVNHHEKFLLGERGGERGIKSLCVYVCGMRASGVYYEN